MWGVGAFGQAHKPLVVVQSGEAVVSIGRKVLVVGGQGGTMVNTAWAVGRWCLRLKALIVV